MILRKHPAWAEKNHGIWTCVCSIHCQALISRFVKVGLLPTQSCSAVSNSATAPIDSSKEIAQYDASRKAVSQTNLCDPLWG